MSNWDKLFELAERNGVRVHIVKELTPLERINNIGRSMEIRKRIEEERRSKPMTKAQKMRLGKTVKKFYENMENYLDNISYK